MSAPAPTTAAPTAGAAPAAPAVAHAPPGWQVWGALWIVYLVWGSTYLAIRVMVETVPPLLGAGARFAVAGAVLLLVLGLRLGWTALRPDAVGLPWAAATFALRTCASSTSRADPVLDGVELDVVPGKTIALLGPTGAGKTTLVSLVPRFYDVTEGRVLVDGDDVRDVDAQVAARADRDRLAGAVPLLASVAREHRLRRADATQAEIEAAAGAARTTSSAAARGLRHRDRRARRHPLRRPAPAPRIARALLATRASSSSTTRPRRGRATAGGRAARGDEAARRSSSPTGWPPCALADGVVVLDRGQLKARAPTRSC